jgi:hypothetical protein
LDAQGGQQVLPSSVISIATSGLIFSVYSMLVGDYFIPEKSWLDHYASTRTVSLGVAFWDFLILFVLGFLIFCLSAERARKLIIVYGLYFLILLFFTLVLMLDLVLMIRVSYVLIWVSFAVMVSMLMKLTINKYFRFR